MASRSRASSSRRRDSSPSMPRMASSCRAMVSRRSTSALGGSVAVPASSPVSVSSRVTSANAVSWSVSCRRTSTASPARRSFSSSRSAFCSLRSSCVSWCRSWSGACATISVESSSRMSTSTSSRLATRRSMALSIVPVKSSSWALYRRSDSSSTRRASEALVSPICVSAAFSRRLLSVEARRVFSSAGTTPSNSPWSNSALFSNSAWSSPKSFLPTGYSSRPSRNCAVTSPPVRSNTATVPRSKSRVIAYAPSAHSTSSVTRKAPPFHGRHRSSGVTTRCERRSPSSP